MNVAQENIDLTEIRGKEINKLEKNIRDFTTRLVNKKTKLMERLFEKNIKRIPVIENELIELSVRVSKLEKIIERGKK